MSLGVVVKGPEGIVLAADSRITLEAKHPGQAPIVVNFDNATKLLSFKEPHNFVGAVTYGAAVIGLRTAHSYVPEFESTLEKQERLKVQEYCQKMSAFFMDLWREVMPPDYVGSGMIFIVGGYDPVDAYGKVFLFDIPNRPNPEPQNPGEKDFGLTWGGQLHIASRLIHGYDPELLNIVRQTLNPNQEQMDRLAQALSQSLVYQIPYQVLPLQDCIDLAAFLVRTTVVAQNLAIGVRGVGGPIEVAIIRRTKGLQFVQRKKIHGEGAQTIEED